MIVLSFAFVGVTTFAADATSATIDVTFAADSIAPNTASTMTVKVTFDGTYVARAVELPFVAEGFTVDSIESVLLDETPSHQHCHAINQGLLIWIDFNQTAEIRTITINCVITAGDAGTGKITFDKYNGYLGDDFSVGDIFLSDNEGDVYSKELVINAAGGNDDFQIDKYRANYLLNSYTGLTMEKEYLNFDTPSKTITDTGKKNGLSTMANIWKYITGTVENVDDPTKIVGYAAEQKDVYEAIIMELLETSFDNRIMECINNDLTKERKELTDLVINDMKNLYNYENISAYKNICSMDDEFINQLKKTIEDDFEYEYGNAQDISKISTVIEKTIEYATDFEKYCEKLIAFCKMLQLSDSMKNIVQEMYRECPPENLALRTALKECTTILNAGTDEFTNIMVTKFFGVVGLRVGEFFFDKMWDNIKTEFMIVNPSGFAISAAYKTGKYISNVAFNTDTIVEEYFKLAAINKVEDLLKVVYEKIKASYQTGGTIQQAKNYNTIVDFMFNMMNTDCRYAITYLNETDDTLVAKVKQAFKQNGIDDAISHVEQLEKKYDFFHEKVTTEWIVDIANKYPDIFKLYLSVLENSLEKQKAYFINCPVDVYVYDKGGELVGSVINNEPYCKENANITIGVIGDRKTIYMYGDEYDIVYKGNDSGTMDITVTEYDETNSAVRNIYFNNLELTEGLTYTSSETGKNSAENVYTLSNEAAESIASDYDSLTDAETETFTAQVTGGYFTDTMAVLQNLHIGENVDISAYIPEGYKFVNWSSDAESDIFDDANSITTKITMPEYDVTISANLVSVPTLSISSIADDNVVVKAKGCENISEGKMILAIYDENGVLEQLKAENYAEEVTFSELKLKSGTAKVLLWSNMNNLLPFTEPREKIFYFTSPEIE